MRCGPSPPRRSFPRSSSLPSLWDWARTRRSSACCTPSCSGLCRMTNRTGSSACITSLARPTTTCPNRRSAPFGTTARRSIWRLSTPTTAREQTSPIARSPSASASCRSDPTTFASSACACSPGNRSTETPSAPTPASSSSASGSGASISAPVPTRSDRRCRSTASVSRSLRWCPMRSRTRSCPASRSGRHSTSRVRTGRSGTTTI